MVVSCSAYNCTNRAIEKGENHITFHSFPKDQILMKKWIIAMKRDKWIPTKHSKLCSHHFSPDSYETAGWSSRPRLKSNAVPTIFKFPEHLQKKEKPIRRSLIKRQHEVEKTLDLPLNNDVQNENRVVIKNVQKKPRLCYLGDLKNQISETAAVDFSAYSDLAGKILEKKNKQIKHLQQKTLRLNKKVTSLQSLVSNLQAKNLATDKIAQTVIW